MKKNNPNPKARSRFTFRKKLAIVAFTLYITFILLSAMPYLAESNTRSPANMDNMYNYNLIFTEDGESTHYDVERVDTNEDGEISVTYTTASHTLEVVTTNIKKLTIDSRSMYNDESQRVFKEDPNADPNYYKTYFRDHDRPFTVSVNADNVIEIRFKDAPTPVEVYVNEVEWWKTGTNYQYDGSDIVLMDVPQGSDTYVEIYFTAREEEDKEEKDDEDEGMFGLGKVLGIDLFLWIIIIIIVIILIAMAMAMKKSSEKKAEEEKEAVEEEEMEEIEEEVEKFECPECGEAITEDMANCDSCGATLEWSEEDVEEGEFECPDCGASIASDATSCPECGVEFDEEEEIAVEEEVVMEPAAEEAVVPEPAGEEAVAAETTTEEEEEDNEFECPDCGASIGEDATTCFECGAEFE